MSWRHSNARPGVVSGSEDWLVLITADHGGEGTSHFASQGLINWEVPFVISGDSVPAGTMLPQGTLRDVATTALWHLGVDPFGTNVDGRVRGIAVRAAQWHRRRRESERRRRRQRHGPRRDRRRDGVRRGLADRPDIRRCSTRSRTATSISTARPTCATGSFSIASTRRWAAPCRRCSRRRNRLPRRLRRSRNGDRVASAPAAHFA